MDNDADKMAEVILANIFAVAVSIGVIALIFYIPELFK